MANQLIQSARRMYASKYKVVDNTPIIKALISGTTSLVKGYMSANQRIKKQEEENEKFFNKKLNSSQRLTNDPESRKIFTNELLELQKLFRDGGKQSIQGGVLTSRKNKNEGAEKQNIATTSLDAYREDLTYLDAILKSDKSNNSAANTINDRSDQVRLNSNTTPREFVFVRADNEDNQPAGIYVRRVADEGLVRLSDYEKPIKIFTTGQEIIASDIFDYAVKQARRGVKDFERIKSKSTGILNRLSQDRNFASLLFDDLEGLVFAEEYLKLKGVDISTPEEKFKQLEALKLQYKQDPKDLNTAFFNDIIEEANDLFNDNQKTSTVERTQLTQDKLNKQNTFVRSLNAGGDVIMPDGSTYRPGVGVLRNTFYLVDKQGRISTKNEGFKRQTLIDKAQLDPSIARKINKLP